MGSKRKDYYASQKRMMFIMERATRKFPGDLSLWVQYLDIARRQKAYKMASQILTSMARLHPTKPVVWTYAAKYALEEQGDMSEARSYMTRGRRFCRSSPQLWLESAKLELVYIAKIAARRRILGLDEQRLDVQIPDEDDPDADVVALPAITAEDFDPSLKNIEAGDGDPSKKLDIILGGAIPTAIFNSAMDEFKDENVGGEFFDMIASIQGVPCSRNLLDHVVERLRNTNPVSPVTLDAVIRLPLVGVEPTSAEFPRALGPVLALLKSSMEEHPSLELATRTVEWIVSYLKQELDEDIRTVLSAILSKTLSQYQNIATQTDLGSAKEASELLDRLRVAKAPTVEHAFSQWAIAIWPSDSKLRQIIEAAPVDTVVVH